ncbi:alpha/beta hydrolase [Williamsia sterculiae]|uniref:AB hydrolase-1 domain-containing protein n=1 Tax=Williamsia sterculiae TaxID=1344003 RepID=A0A1N7EX27_9NOCA|nr:alpha/beta fold hydrolase [Williamsia sterculiae]SIR92639.1 hypothetical protein SAMN05445060_1607 [Williamsia sterculiae]
MTRNDITFPSGSTTCAGWLYRPSDAADRRPVIVMAHGLGGVKEERLDAFAERFTDAGYMCLVFDYRYFGASGGQPRQLLDINAQLADWRAAVDFARTLDGADPERIVVWGTSFSGGHSIITAARDHRIVAAVSQCPFTNGLASSLAIPPVTSAKLTALALRDQIGARLGRAPVMVSTYGAPGDTALMTAPDVVSGLKAIIPTGSTAPKDVAARIALHITWHRPGRYAKDVRCPIFFGICEKDTVAPPGPTRKYAAQAPHSEVKLYDAGHFDIYVGEDFERNVTDQLDFLNRHVPMADHV